MPRKNIDYMYLNEKLLKYSTLSISYRKKQFSKANLCLIVDIPYFFSTQIVLNGIWSFNRLDRMEEDRRLFPFLQIF